MQNTLTSRGLKGGITNEKKKVRGLQQLH